MGIWAIVLASAFAAAWSDDLAGLSDEFGEPTLLPEWQRRFEVEGWEDAAPNRSANQWEWFYVDETNHACVIAPYSGGFYNDFIGGLAFKAVTGDFVATARLRVTARNGTPVPSSQYSLAGILIRQPQQALSAVDWVRGRENYLFLSLGRGDANAQQWEIKNTINGTSVLVLSNAVSNVAMIQAVRIGNRFVFLRRTDAEGWVVHGRYDRSANPLPATLQVGMTAYTDWQKWATYLTSTHTVDGTPNVDGVWVHNTHYLDPSLPASLTANGLPYNPDIIAYFDYFRFARPSADAVADLTTNALAAIPAATLIQYFADNANRPGPPDITALAAATGTLAAAIGGLGSGFVYRVEQSLDTTAWHPVDGTMATATVPRVALPLPATGADARLFRAVRIEE